MIIVYIIMLIIIITIICLVDFVVLDLFPRLSPSCAQELLCCIYVMLIVFMLCHVYPIAIA